MEFNNATTDNSIIALNKAIEYAKKYGDIKQIISDHGTQFTANKKNKKGRAEHTFEQYPEKQGIEQIFARVKHPQTNGKMERWFGCYKQHRDRFDKLEDFVDWYNDKRPPYEFEIQQSRNAIGGVYKKNSSGNMVWICCENV